MTEISAIFVVLAIGYVGLVLHCALAKVLLSFDGPSSAAGDPSEQDLLFLGVLPGFALVGMMGLYLSLFRLLQPQVLAVALAAIVVWRREDARETLKAIYAAAQAVGRAYRSFDIFAIGASFLTILFLVGYFINIHIPFDAPDIAVFQMPISRSMVSHHGFIYPQIGTLFFSYNPLFFNVMFAELMLYVNSTLTPGILNIVVYFSYIAFLTTFYRVGHSAGFFIGLIILAYSSFFSTLVGTPMLDILRISYSAVGMLFTYRYLNSDRLYDIVMAGVAFGAAIGGHYLELIPLAVASVSLMPRLRAGRAAWAHAGFFVATLIVMAGYWYIRNAIIFGNPVWPLLFGHQGMDAKDYAAFVHDLTVPLNLQDRYLSNNLLSLDGWRSFAYVSYKWFLTLMPGALSVILIGLGLMIGRARIRLLIGWIAVLFFIWFVLMFHLRWALLVFLLLCSTAVIGSASLYERIVTLKDQASGAAGRSWLPKVGIAAAAVLCLAVGLRIAVHGFAVLPTWVPPSLVRTLLAGGSFDDYLAREKPGYQIHRYIFLHADGRVLAPLDRDGQLRNEMYNDARKNRWIIEYKELPLTLAGLDEFLETQEVKYFIDQPTVLPGQGRTMDAAKTKFAEEILASLKPRAQLIMTDPFGWSLYKIK